MRDYNAKALYPHHKKLSSTQVLDYAKDPALFHLRWVDGVPMKMSPALAFGIGFAEAYADRNFDYKTYMLKYKVAKRLISHMDYVLPMFPELPKGCAEYELICEHRGWKFRITLDGFLEDQGMVIENKTGQLVWDQNVCDNHPQITMQSWAYRKKYGKLAKKIMVNWVDTSTQAKKPIHTFHVKRSISELNVFEKNVIDKVIDNLEAGNFSNKFKTIDGL